MIEAVENDHIGHNAEIVKFDEVAEIADFAETVKNFEFAEFADIAKTAQMVENAEFAILTLWQILPRSPKIPRFRGLPK